MFLINAQLVANPRLTSYTLIKRIKLAVPEMLEINKLV